MTKPNEPTLTCSEHAKDCPCWGDIAPHLDCTCPLTCSEVVERLYKECFTREMMGMGGTLARYAGFDKDKATAILHSWRERRVQELEELIAKHSGCSHCNDSASGNTSEEGSAEIRKTEAL